jgi:hypothetical protein
MSCVAWGAKRANYSRLGAIFAADVVGYSSMMEWDESGNVDFLAGHGGKLACNVQRYRRSKERCFGAPPGRVEIDFGSYLHGRQAWA